MNELRSEMRSKKFNNYYKGNTHLPIRSGKKSQPFPVYSSSRLTATMDKGNSRNFSGIKISVKNNEQKVEKEKKKDPFTIVFDEFYSISPQKNMGTLVTMKVPPDAYKEEFLQRLWNKKRIEKVLYCLEAYINVIGWDKIDSSLYPLNLNLCNVKTIDAILKENRSPEDKWCAIASASMYFVPTKDFKQVNSYYNFRRDETWRIPFKLFKNRSSLKNIKASIENLSFVSCSSYLMPFFPVIPISEKDSFRYEMQFDNEKFLNNHEIIIDRLIKSVQISNYGYSPIVNRTLIQNPKRETLISDVEVDKTNDDIFLFDVSHKSIDSILVYSFNYDFKIVSELESELNCQQFVELFSSLKVLLELKENEMTKKEKTFNAKMSAKKVTIDDFILLQHKRAIKGNRFQHSNLDAVVYFFNRKEKMVRSVSTYDELVKLDVMINSNKNLYSIVSQSYYLYYHFLCNSDWFDNFEKDFETIFELINDKRSVLYGGGLNSEGQLSSVFLHRREQDTIDFIVKELDRKDSSLANVFEKYVNDPDILSLLVDLDDSMDRFFNFGNVSFISPEDPSSPAYLNNIHNILNL